MTEERTLRLPRRLAAVLLLCVLAAALLAVGFWRWYPAPQPAGSPDVATDSALALALDAALKRGVEAAPGIAIRPLALRGDAAGATSLADNLCDALAQRLARLPALRIVPCRSTAVAVAAELSDEALGRLLAVRHVLAGSLEALPENRLRVRLALHDMRGGQQEWRVDEELGLGDLQGLPSRIAQETGRALGLPIETAAERLLDPDLYAKFLRAGELARRPVIEERRAALGLVGEVLAAEPDHLPALRLSWNLRSSLVGNLGPPGERESAAQMLATREALRRESLVLARRMIEADPLDLRGHALLLSADIQSRQWLAAFTRLDEMLNRHAQYPGLMRLAARVYLHAGYVTRAGELALAAAQLNALDAEALGVLAQVRLIEGDGPALRELMSVARQIGNDEMAYMAFLDAYRRGDWAIAERELAAWVGKGGKWPADWVPAYARALADPALRADVVAQFEAQDGGTRQHFGHYFIELALLQEHERSLKAIQHHAGQPPAAWLQWLWLPEFAPVRAQAGFVSAAQQIGFTALWDVRGAPDACTRSASGLWTCR